MGLARAGRWLGLGAPLWLGAAVAVLAGCTGPGAAAPSEPPPARYTPDPASLAQHRAAPEWFRDAKLGIYFHWGPYTVPEYETEWYPRLMYFDVPQSEIPEGLNAGDHTKVRAFHERTYGPVEEFNYHDLIPQFTGEEFDPEEWADLFVAAGARFAGPVGEHHDGFAMWDSVITPWNAADMGPKRDITGELLASLRKRDVKTVVTFHHARHLQRYRDMDREQASFEWEGDYLMYWDSHYPWTPGTAVTSDDPALRLLYGNMPEDEWLEDVWLGKLDEVIALYEPDMIWFDAWLREIPDEYLNRFSANYLNAGERWGKDVLITAKNLQIDPAWAVEDFEKGRRAELTEEPWLTDDTISDGSWSYTTDLPVKPLSRVVRDFVDIVSKNGQLLLNISPDKHGRIPKNQRDVLLGLGDWLEVNGEAIYETRPWTRFGEGPTVQTSEGHFMDAVDYVAEDVRFTTRGDTLYAISLGVPRSPFTIASLGDVEVESVTLLGGDSDVAFAKTDDGLQLTFEPLPDAPAYTFKITPKR